MRTKQIFFLLFLFIFLTSSIAYAVPPFSNPESSSQDIGINIVYPTTNYLKKETKAVMPFDVLSYNYTRLTNTNTDCIYGVVNQQGDIIAYGNLTYNATLKYWHFILYDSQTKDSGAFNYYVYCNSSYGSEKGYISNSYIITNNGLETITPTNEYLTFGLLMFVAFVLILFMHIFKEDIGSSVAYGVFAFIILLFIGVMTLFGFQIIDTNSIVLPFNINKLIGLVCIILGIYSLWFSTALYKHKKEEREE